MAILDQDMQDMVACTMLSFAATVNADGSPNVSPKSSLRVHDGDRLLFANIASPGTLRNLRRDPRIEINCVDIFARRGYRFSGTATIHSDGDPLYEELRRSVKAEHGETIPVFDAVLVEVAAARPVLSPAYDFVEGVTEAALRTAYQAKYGVRPAAEAAE